MKKELIALGAALALVGTLTACSSTPADQNKGSAGSGATGSTTGSAAGTAYPRSTRSGMTGTAGGHGYTYDGRYTAFPDGRVAPGRGNAARDMERVGKGVADGTRDLVNGVGDVVRDAGNGLRDAGQAVPRWCAGFARRPVWEARPPAAGAGRPFRGACLPCRFSFRPELPRACLAGASPRRP